MSDIDLHGRRVLVVGGETELGRAVLIGLAEAGVDIAIASLTSDTKAEFAINSALNELWALDRKGVALAIDASDADTLRQVVVQAESELGVINLVVTIGDVAIEALAGHDTIVLASNAVQDEALTTIRERLQGG